MITIKWNGDSVTLMDQRFLPCEEKYNTYTHYSDVAMAIKNMEIRGAPAIGITVAMGIALAARNIHEGGSASFREEMNRAMDVFAATRPTAISLFSVIDRMKKIVNSYTDTGHVVELLEKEALAIYDEDLAANKVMGRNGSRFLANGDIVMTHCNAGALATAGYGTALGVIRAAVEEGKSIHVYACETRPYLQGARLTSWELMQDGIPVTLITDSMAGYFMRKGDIKKIIVGADRIAANGDTANKIGTYSHSVLAREHKIPFFVAAQTNIIDPGTKSGDQIIIEERGVDEVGFIGSERIAPEGIFIRNPAFDVTPAANITALITEKGVIEHPDANGIARLMEKAGQ